MRSKLSKYNYNSVLYQSVFSPKEKFSSSESVLFKIIVEVPLLFRSLQNFILPFEGYHQLAVIYGALISCSIYVPLQTPTNYQKLGGFITENHSLTIQEASSLKLRCSRLASSGGSEGKSFSLPLSLVSETP